MRPETSSPSEIIQSRKGLTHVMVRCDGRCGRNTQASETGRRPMPYIRGFRAAVPMRGSCGPNTCGWTKTKDRSLHLKNEGFFYWLKSKTIRMATVKVKFRASAVPAKEGTLFIRSVLGTEQRQPFPARTASTGNHATTRGRRHLSPG